MKNLYIDIYNQIWERRREEYYPFRYYVWSELLGKGVWDNGRGLTKI